MSMPEGKIEGGSGAATDQASVTVAHDHSSSVHTATALPRRRMQVAVQSIDRRASPRTASSWTKISPHDHAASLPDWKRTASSVALVPCPISIHRQRSLGRFCRPFVQERQHCLSMGTADRQIAIEIEKRASRSGGCTATSSVTVSCVAGWTRIKAYWNAGLMRSKCSAVSLLSDRREEKTCRNKRREKYSTPRRSCRHPPAMEARPGWRDVCNGRRCFD